MYPARQNAEFVAAMEDVLEVYHRPYDPKRPLVALDEASKQLISETRVPISQAPGRAATSTTSTSATGRPTCSWSSSRWAGSRTPRHRAADGEGFRRSGAGTGGSALPRRREVVLVMDNLNTHRLASLYEAFPPEQARRIITKLEIHYTPKHGSWLDWRRSN